MDDADSIKKIIDDLVNMTINTNAFSLPDNRDKVIYENVGTSRLVEMMVDAECAYAELTLNGTEVRDSPQELFWVNRYNEIENVLISRGFFD